MVNVLRELTRIITAVAHAGSPSEQVLAIVDSIQAVIQADVCSLYKVQANDDLVLLASHGLDHSQPVVIPAGEGLVGNIVRNRRELNLADALKHPDYYHVPKIGEESFHSFCGAPLVDHGQVVGVLVVQQVQANILSDENVAFLTTLASHLAIIVRSIDGLENKKNVNERVSCVSGSPGVGIGKVITLKSYNLDEISFSTCEDSKREIAAWKLLLKNVESSLEQEKILLSNEAGENIAGVFSAFQMFINDKAFTDIVEAEINAGLSIPSALKKAVVTISAVFHGMDDPYLKARGEDIWNLGNRIYEQWLDEPTFNEKDIPLDEDIILVGANIDISDIAAYAKYRLVGVVSCHGSALSHLAVIANALGLPALLGFDKSKMPQSMTRAIVDGNEGVFIIRPSKAVKEEYKALVQKERSLLTKYESEGHLAANTLDGFEVQLYANTGLLADLSLGLKYGAQGIGLYRTEIPFLIRDSFPTEDEQVNVYKQVLAAYPDKPVYMRTLDVGGDKPLPYFVVEDEANPALGWRGIRFTLDNVQLLMTQLRAMLRASVGHKGLHILIPMVSSTHEIVNFNKLLNDAYEQLKQEQLTIQKPKVGVMVEVPSAISQIGFWSKHIDFISIGSNDLSQYLLAVDRNNFRVAKLSDNVHPAIIHELYRIMQAAKQQQLPVCLCGEMGADPIAVILLLGMGINKLSLSSSRLPKIKYLIRHMSVNTAESFLQQALLLDNAKDIRRLGLALLNDHGLHELLE